MDSISIIIIVTVLSLGSALVYLFKSDFEKRKRSLLSSNNKAIQQQQRKHSQHHSRQQTSNKTNQKPTATTSASKQNVPQQQPEAKANKHSASKKISTSSMTSLPETLTGQCESIRGPEPSIDELDSSILLKVFDPTENLPSDRTKHQVESFKHQENLSLMSQQQPKSAVRSKFGKKNSLIAKNQDSLLDQSNDYSSDQLFKMIAASNLSKEEIELAVETLLNKSDLGETVMTATTTNGVDTNGTDGWRQPKNDPLQKLKNQLKDTETALSIEIQNHELTRARLCELKDALQTEKFSSVTSKDELSKLKKELDIVNLALEQSRSDLSKQQSIVQKKLKEENIKLLNKFEQQQLQIQNFVNQLANKDNEVLSLHKDLEEKCKLLALNENKNEQLEKLLKEMEVKLNQQENHVEQFKKLRQQDEYELLAKLNEIESDKLRLEKILKDRMENLNESLKANNLLEKSVKELQLINSRQEDMLTRLRDERHLDEESMKRTLDEMQSELKELQNKLLLKDDQQTRQQQMHNGDGGDKNKLILELKQLREGLASLIPELKDKVELNFEEGTTDWVQQYLLAIKQLGKTVDELKSQTSLDTGNVSLSSTSPSPTSSPSKKSMNGGFRVKSPVSPSGRKSNNSTGNGDKKIMETKLLELSDYSAKLEDGGEQKVKHNSDSASSLLSLNQVDDEHQQLDQLKRRVKDLSLKNSKFEAQIKFGLDSLRAEQDRVRELEFELASFKSK